MSVGQHEEVGDGTISRWLRGSVGGHGLKGTRSPERAGWPTPGIATSHPGTPPLSVTAVTTVTGLVISRLPIHR